MVLEPVADLAGADDQGRRPQRRRRRAARRAVAQTVRQPTSSAVARPNWIAIRPESVADGSAELDPGGDDDRRGGGRADDRGDPVEPADLGVGVVEPAPGEQEPRSAG